MRYIVAFLVFVLLASWSVLVHSYSRSETDILRYGNLLKDCPPLQKLSIDSQKGWNALVRFYPVFLLEKLSVARKDVPSDEVNQAIDPRQINHLVEIYLRSHSLAPCGHKEIHETVGTLCSVSSGTEFFSLYEDIMAAMYRQGAMDCRTLLYLLESEPADWSTDEPYFFMKDRIVSSTVSVNDVDVEAKRQELIREGFQTASYWSYEDVRKAIVSSKNGERLSDIDLTIGVSRGELRMTLSNCFVRPLFLLRNWDNESYEGRLDGLIPFIVENIGRDLGVGDLNQIRSELNVNVVQMDPGVTVHSVRTEAPVTVKVPAEIAAPSAVKVPVGTKAKASNEAVDKNSQKEKSSFARAYGGSRFHMSWGN